MGLLLYFAAPIFFIVLGVLCEMSVRYRIDALKHKWTPTPPKSSTAEYQSNSWTGQQ